MTKEEKIRQLAEKALQSSEPEQKDNYLRQIVLYSIMPESEYVLREWTTETDR